MVRIIIVLGIFSFLGMRGNHQPQRNIPRMDFTEHFKHESLTLLEVGKVNFPTGKIIVSDPFYTSDQKPFKKSVAPGAYLVELYIAKVEEDYYSNAFSRLKIKQDSAKHWELAVPEDISNEQIEALESDGFFGFPVDAGLACFVDEKTNKIFMNTMVEFYNNRPDGNYYDDVLADEFAQFSGQHKMSRELGDWNIHKLGEGAMVPMFASGYGDGYYPCYWGYNEDNEIVELVVDFLLFTEE